MMLSLFLPCLVKAHPHVYVVNRFTLIFDDQGLTGVRVHWVFDKFFSSMILEEFAPNSRETLAPAEITAIEKGAFSHLANHDYFLHMKIDGHPFKVREIRDFTAAKRDGALIYEFTVLCRVPPAKRPRQVHIAPYDPSFYSYILFAEDNPVRIQNGDKYDATVKVEKNPEAAYFHGQVQPYEMILQFGLKNG